MQAANPPAKLTLAQLRAGMSVFLTFPSVEKEIQDAKDSRIAYATEFVTQVNKGEPGTAADIVDLLAVGTAKEYEQRLKLLLATSAGSLEVMDRVCLALCPDQATWNERRKSATATKAIAEFLINPDSAAEVPWYIRERLRLPTDFLNLIESSISREIHHSLQAQYNTSSGLAVEKAISDLVTQAGYKYQKGQVSFVDDKEVDVVVPELVLPRILIMASYNLTTSSAQSQRAREQEKMYADVKRYNGLRTNQNSPAVQYVNVVDGGGWLSRSQDLAQLHRHCDYALSVSQLPQHLPLILKYHMEQ